MLEEMELSCEQLEIIHAYSLKWQVSTEEAMNMIIEVGANEIEKRKLQKRPKMRVLIGNQEDP